MNTVGLRASVRLLTILPLRWDAREQNIAAAQTTAWFPVVGALIGLGVWGILNLPIPALPRAALALFVWIGLTGGLHEDALMDSADACLAIGDAQKRAQIRKDPHIGAHAATTSGLSLLLRFAALSAVAPVAGFAAPIVGRWSMAVTLSLFRSAPDSLAAAYSAGVGKAAPTLVAIVLLGLLSFAFNTPLLIAAALTALAVGVFCAHLMMRRLGAANGDLHGAAGMIAEIALLYLLVLVP